MAKKYDLFFTLAMHFHFFYSSFPSGLLDITEDFRKKLKNYGEMIHEIYLRFSSLINMQSVYTLLKDKDFIYLEYAVMGLTNKEVAARVNKSMATVANKYVKIYNALGVNGKHELVDLYNRAMENAGLKNII